jgi:hypothetical protein
MSFFYKKIRDFFVIVYLDIMNQTWLSTEQLESVAAEIMKGDKGRPQMVMDSIIDEHLGPWREDLLKAFD